MILRHTLMNPFLLDDGHGRTYLELYFDWLGQRCEALLPAARAA